MATRPASGTERDGYLCQIAGRDAQAGRPSPSPNGRLRPGSPLGPADYDLTLLVAACRDCNRMSARTEAIRRRRVGRGGEV